MTALDVAAATQTPSQRPKSLVQIKYCRDCVKLRVVFHRYAHSFNNYRCTRLRELVTYVSALFTEMRGRWLAGWQFDANALDDADQLESIKAVFSTATVDGFASTHTCLPALREFIVDNDIRWVINNGAAGMPNFTSTQFGLLSRISVFAPAQGSSLYGLQAKGVYVDASPIHYDHTRWREVFRANWPVESPAYISYNNRIERGPQFQLGTLARVQQ